MARTMTEPTSPERQSHTQMLAAGRVTGDTRSNGTHSFAASADGAVPFHSDGAQHLAFARLGHGARRRRQKPSAARAPADLISSHRPGGSSSAGSAGKAGWLPGKLAPVCISLRLIRSEQTTSACRRRQVRPGGCRSLGFKKPAADPSPCLRSGTRVCVRGASRHSRSVPRHPLPVPTKQVGRCYSRPSGLFSLFLPRIVDDDGSEQEHDTPLPISFSLSVFISSKR